MAQSPRVEIAQEIHDGIAQDLVALGYQLDLVLAAPLTPALIRNDIRINDLERQLLLRIIPELLHNAQNHSGASQIQLHLEQVKDRAMVKVSDNGHGGAAPHSGRYGLLGVLERVKDHGASIEIDSRKDGTTITITL